MNALLKSLPSAARVTERLVAQLGYERIREIQERGEHTYRVLLNDGSVAFATVADDGSVRVRELEAV